MKFYTKYNVPKFEGNHNDGIQEEGMDTQQYGYQSVEKQVSRLIMSGARLSDFRCRPDQYTFKDGIDDGRPIDRTTVGNNYDLADVSADLRYLSSVAQVKKVPEKTDPDKTNILEN